MTREDIIRMAREAGFDMSPISSVVPKLERFAALVATHALVEPCCGNYDQCQKVCMPRAAAAEREACARECEIQALDGVFAPDDLADAIRARGNKT